MNKPTYEKWGNNNYHNPSFWKIVKKIVAFAATDQEVQNIAEHK